MIVNSQNLHLKINKKRQNYLSYLDKSVRQIKANLEEFYFKAKFPLGIIFYQAINLFSIPHFCLTLVVDVFLGDKELNIPAMDSQPHFFLL